MTNWRIVEETHNGHPIVWVLESRIFGFWINGSRRYHSFKQALEAYDRVTAKEKKVKIIRKVVYPPDFVGPV